MDRSEGRKADELRTWRITRGILDHAEGSALVEAGRTRVIVAATVEERVPAFLRNGGSGWVTAEYAMLPRSTHTRSPRERGGRVGGRTLESQRMIGRSLRGVTDLSALGERTITLDCDVIQADGGTRSAAISGAWVALHDALGTLVDAGFISDRPLLDSITAVSVGIVADELVLDLDYEEDSVAEVDMNVVMTGRGRLVEVQATAEGKPFSLARMNALVRLAQRGIREIEALQRSALGG